MIMVRMPALTNRSVIASPMPEPPPVMIAVLADSIESMLNSNLYPLIEFRVQNIAEFFRSNPMYGQELRGLAAAVTRRMSENKAGRRSATRRRRVAGYRGAY